MILSADKVDCFSIQELFSFFHDNSIFEEKNSPFLYQYVYVFEERVVGFLQYQVIYERSELDYLIVHPDFRRKKIASALLDFMFLNLSKEILNVTLEVRKSNQEAIRIYEKYGFKKCAVRKKYYHGEDGLLMMKEMML